MSKFTFDQALEMISEERPVDSNNVQAAALRRKVWLMRAQYVGCLPDSHSVYLTKEAAIAGAWDLYHDADDLPRGFREHLRNDGIAALDAQGMCYVVVERLTLGDLL